MIFWCSVVGKILFRRNVNLILWIVFEEELIRFWWFVIIGKTSGEIFSLDGGFCMFYS